MVFGNHWLYSRRFLLVLTLAAGVFFPFSNAIATNPTAESQIGQGFEAPKVPSSEKIWDVEKELHEVRSGATSMEMEIKKLRTDILELNKALSLSKSATSILNSRIDNSFQSVQKLSALAITVVGVLLTFVNLFMTFLITYAFKKTFELSGNFKKAELSVKDMLNKVEKVKNENEIMIKNSWTVQKELSRTIWLSHEELTRQLRANPDKDVNSIIVDFMDLMGNVDGYRWAILNTVSPNRDARIQAILTIATKQKQFPIASSYLRTLIKVYQGPEYETEREIIRAAIRQ